MIICSRCETAQFLQIATSSIEFRHDDVRKIDELYECTNCDGQGRYWYLFDDECVTGSIELTEDRPLMVR